MIGYFIFDKKELKIKQYETTVGTDSDILVTPFSYDKHDIEIALSKIYGKENLDNFEIIKVEIKIIKE